MSTVILPPLTLVLKTSCNTGLQNSTAGRTDSKNQRCCFRSCSSRPDVFHPFLCPLPVCSGSPLTLQANVSCVMLMYPTSWCRTQWSVTPLMALRTANVRAQFMQITVCWIVTSYCFLDIRHSFVGMYWRKESCRRNGQWQSKWGKTDTKSEPTGDRDLTVGDNKADLLRKNSLPLSSSSEA